MGMGSEPAESRRPLPSTYCFSELRMAFRCAFAA